MPAPRPDRTAAQPRRSAGVPGGRGGQWSNKPMADPLPPGGGMELGEGEGPDAAGETPGSGAPAQLQESAAEVDKIKLTGPKAGGRRLTVIVKRDPGTGEWSNPTVFGDATVRTLSDTPWNEEGAEEAKGLHAQVFVDMLNAGDARPCPTTRRRRCAGRCAPGRSGQDGSYSGQDDLAKAVTWCD